MAHASDLQSVRGRRLHGLHHVARFNSMFKCIFDIAACAPMLFLFVYFLHPLNCIALDFILIANCLFILPPSFFSLCTQAPCMPGAKVTNARNSIWVFASLHHSYIHRSLFATINLAPQCPARISWAVGHPGHSYQQPPEAGATPTVIPHDFRRFFVIINLLCLIRTLELTC